MTRHRPLDDVRDHRTLFTQEELARAYCLVIDQQLAASRAADTYAAAEEGGDCYFSPDTFILLALVSDDVSNRVQALLNATDSDLAELIADLRSRLAIGSPG